MRSIPSVSFLSLFLSPISVFGFQNLFKDGSLKIFGVTGKTDDVVPRFSRLALEEKLLGLIADGGRRSANSDQISAVVSELEKQNPTSEPAIAPEIYGRWKLLYATRADTSSPIQRGAVGSQNFPIYQDIVVDDDGRLKVNQVVQFSEAAKLSVDALASTASYPLEELTERQGTGKILGLNLLGVSLVGEEGKPDPKRPNSRIDFVFDEGNFEFGMFKVPYPVPFRLPILRDTVKGWIDITYLSDRIRISRGNKGTTFVLEKVALIDV